MKKLDGLAGRDCSLAFSLKASAPKSSTRNQFNLAACSCVFRVGVFCFFTVAPLLKVRGAVSTPRFLN